MHLMKGNHFKFFYNTEWHLWKKIWISSVYGNWPSWVQEWLLKVLWCSLSVPVSFSSQQWCDVVSQRAFWPSFLADPWMVQIHQLHLSPQHPFCWKIPAVMNQALGKAYEVWLVQQMKYQRREGMWCVMIVAMFSRTWWSWNCSFCGECHQLAHQRTHCCWWDWDSLLQVTNFVAPQGSLLGTVVHQMNHCSHSTQHHNLPFPVTTKKKNKFWFAHG